MQDVSGASPSTPRLYPSKACARWSTAPTRLSSASTLTPTSSRSYRFSGTETSIETSQLSLETTDSSRISLEETEGNVAVTDRTPKTSVESCPQESVCAPQGQSHRARLAVGSPRTRVLGATSELPKLDAKKCLAPGRSPKTPNVRGVVADVSSKSPSLRSQPRGHISADAQNKDESRLGKLRPAECRRMSALLQREPRHGKCSARERLCAGLSSSASR